MITNPYTDKPVAISYMPLPRAYRNKHNKLKAMIVDQKAVADISRAINAWMYSEDCQ